MRTARRLAVAVVMPLAAFQVHGATVADWRADLDSITDDLRTTHPNPFTKIGPETFARALNKLKDDLPALSEEQRVARAMQLVALIGDGHTLLEPDRADFAWWYPFRIYEFGDGYFVTSAHRSAPGLAGAQVLEIAGRPVADVAADARRLMGADNDFDRLEKLFALSSASLMQGLGYAAGDRSLELRVRLSDGRVETRRVVPLRSSNPVFKTDDSTFEWRFLPELYGPPVGSFDDWTSAFRGLPPTAFRSVDLSRPPHLTFRRAFVTRPMPEQDAYYIQINFVGDGRDETLIDMFKRALAEIDRQKPRRLILDWRYNIGGDGSNVGPMIREFIRRGDDPPWRELYLLTGRRTFSAAIMALDAFSEHATFTVIGEPTGSPLNAFGDPDGTRYPRTGLYLNRSTVLHQLDEYDTRQWFGVDVPTPFDFVAYAAGRDPAVDPILAGE